MSDWHSLSAPAESSTSTCCCQEYIMHDLTEYISADKYLWNELHRHMNRLSLGKHVLISLRSALHNVVNYVFPATLTRLKQWVIITLSGQKKKNKTTKNLYLIRLRLWFRTNNSLSRWNENILTPLSAKWNDFRWKLSGSMSFLFCLATTTKSWVYCEIKTNTSQGVWLQNLNW